jgi:serine/threonine-protein kinase RsbW
VNLHVRADLLVCEVTDQGVGGGDLLVEMLAADVPGGRGLWLAHQLTDSLILTRGPAGVTASVSTYLPPAPFAQDSSPPQGDRVDLSVDEG